MENDTFRIRTWEWEQTSKNSDFPHWEPKECLGRYSVSKLSKFEGDFWIASYFDVYCYETSEKFDDLEEAKKWCWENWISRILPHLIKQNTDNESKITV